MARTNHSKRLQQSVVLQFGYRNKYISDPVEKYELCLDSVQVFVTSKTYIQQPQNPFNKYHEPYYKTTEKTLVISRGILGINNYDQTGHVSSVGTNKEFQGKGHASLMMQTMMEFARQTGLKTVTLGVQNGKDNKPAVRVYEKVGFVFEEGSDYKMIWYNPDFKGE